MKSGGSRTTTRGFDALLVAFVCNYTTGRGDGKGWSATARRSINMVGDRTLSRVSALRERRHQHQTAPTNG